MTAPAIGDACLFATADSMIMQQYGLAFHRRDVAQLVAPCVVTDVREDKNRFPLSIRIGDGSTLVALPGELTVLVNAALVEVADAPPDVGECAENSELARAVAA